MTDTKPTPAEIERARELADKMAKHIIGEEFFAADAPNEACQKCVEIVAQALADARERCAAIADRVSDVTGEDNDALNRSVIQPTWRAASECIAAAIRKGEP